jgi:hypothetical protein
MTRHVSPEILTSFKDALGNVREAPADTVAAIESAMGTRRQMSKRGDGGPAGQRASITRSRRD